LHFNQVFPAGTRQIQGVANGKHPQVDAIFHDDPHSIGFNSTVYSLLHKIIIHGSYFHPKSHFVQVAAADRLFGLAGSVRMETHCLVK
jgi:hypothetical protein